MQFFRYKFISLKILFLIVITALLSSFPKDNHDDTQKHAFYYYSQGLDAYHRQDYSAFLENLKKATKLAPSNPELMYGLARAYALQDNKKKSIKWLEKTIHAGYYFNSEYSGFKKNEYNDFNSIKDSSEFKAVLRKIKRLNTPVNNSERAFRIPERDLIPEGMTYDPIKQAFYIGSVYKRKIISVNIKAEIKLFKKEKQDGLCSVGGMQVDAQRRILWVNSAATSFMKGADKNDFCSPGIFKYDLTKAKLIKKYFLTKGPSFHLFNDLIVNSQGDVFITDSLSDGVYMISEDKDSLDLFLKLEKVIYPNGIALSDDEKYLYVSHTEGISIINVESKTYFTLPHPENLSLAGIDGLYFYRNSLIAVQNGHRPARVIRFFLNENLNRVEKAKIIESSNPLFMFPTTGVVVGNSFYYIANSQLKSFTKDFKIFPLDKLHQVIILKAEL